MLDWDETLTDATWVIGEMFFLHGLACYHLIIDNTTVNPLLSFKINTSLGSTLERLCLSQFERAADSLPYAVKLALFLCLLPWFERTECPPLLLSHSGCGWHWTFIYTCMKGKVLSPTYKWACKAGWEIGLCVRHNSIYFDSFNSLLRESFLYSSESAWGWAVQSIEGKCWENWRAQKVPTVPTLSQERNAHSITLCSV